MLLDKNLKEGDDMSSSIYKSSGKNTIFTGTELAYSLVDGFVKSV